MMTAGISATEKRSAACHERAPATQAATPSTGTTSNAESTRISSANPAAAPVTTGRFVCTPINPSAIARATEGSEKPVATYGRSNVPKTVNAAAARDWSAVARVARPSANTVDAIAATTAALTLITNTHGS